MNPNTYLRTLIFREFPCLAEQLPEYYKSILRKVALWKLNLLD